ncbi:MAG TPA: hypothetical protein VIH71_00830 [Solirubrobacteraceae bacterium]
MDAFDFVVDAVPALEDSPVGVVLAPVVGVVAAVPVDGAPEIVTTCAGGLLTVVLPERPISTPMPTASRSTPIIEMNVLLTDAVRRGDDGVRPGGLSSRRRAGPSSRLTRGAPRRSPHSTQ